MKPWGVPSRAVGGAALLLVLGWSALGLAQQVVPSDLQATILTRMLAYDRALKARAGGSVGIGIVYKTSDKASAQAQGDMLRAFKGLESQTIQGLALTVATRPYKDPADLTSWIATDGIDALYVAPGLAGELESIRAVCREKKVVSMSGVRAFVEQGLAVGVVVKGETPGIVVNMTAAELVGMDLDPKLLQISERIR